MMNECSDKSGWLRGPTNCDRATAYWDATAKEWLETRPQSLWRCHSDALLRRLLTRWLPADCGRLLKTDLFDEAVGEGVLDILAERAAETHGIDMSPAIVEAVRTRPCSLVATVADARALPYDTNSFDCIVSPSTLDHFERADDIYVALSELRRVLRPGGVMILTLDNPANPVVGLRQILPNEPLRRMGVVPYFCGATLTPGALASAVEEQGFRVREQTSVTHSPRVLAVAAARLLQRSGATPSSRSGQWFLNGLMAFEHLERLPTRWLTGHFTAIRAEARH
ncbi:MAG: class I SAM-dependent methyltransferase [Pseudomonadota bacterium]